MKVGTDAIVLGSWAASLALRPERLLDIGTGTGIILLMLMQALEPRLGVGIDIAESISTDTEGNRLASPWAERIELLRADVLSYAPSERFDLIVSNPPYFEADGLGCADARRERARREQAGGLTLRRLMHHASRLLNPEGELLLITPTEREADLRLYGTEALLRLSHLTHVYALPGRPVRILTGWKPLRPHEGYTPTERGCLVLRTTDGAYTDEYRRLTEPFLL